MHRDAGAFARREQARHDRIVAVHDDAPVNVGGDAAHGIVGRRLDGHRRVQRVYALVDAHHFDDVGQLLLQLLRRHGLAAGAALVLVDGLRADVNVHIVLAVDAAPIPDLQIDRARTHIARGQVLHRRRVTLHEALALAIDEHAALAARRLREQDAELVHAGRVELEELHVFQRHAAPPTGCHRVAGKRVRVRRDFEHAPEAARGQQRRFGVKDVILTGVDLDGDGALAYAVLEDQVHDEELVEKLHLLLEALLVERLQDHVAGAVGGLAGAHHGPLAVGGSVSAEAALLDAAIRRAVEGQAHVLQLDDGLDGLARQDLRCILIHQVVAALDGVIHVPLRVVLFHIAERRGDAALRGAGVGARRVKLGDDGDVGGLAGVQRGHQSRAAGADDHGVERVIFDHEMLSPYGAMRAGRQQTLRTPPGR